MKILGDTGLVRIDADEWQTARADLVKAGFKPKSMKQRQNRDRSPFLYDAEGRCVTDRDSSGFHYCTVEAAILAGLINAYSGHEEKENP